jgi:hypothetical protein
MEFYAIKVAHNTFDVFEGKQHHPDFWTRLKAGRNGVYVAKGRSLPHRVVRQLADNIAPNEQTQIIKVDHV